ncbi:MAG: MBL fold metallo-hydrolase RNA specificity domain-containing protein, partial [Candidatus Thermoplasmatota archaeon]
MIKVHGIGGYEEVGKNMSCIEFEDEAVILDMGLYMDRFIAFQEKGLKMDTQALIDEGAIPDDKKIRNLRDKIRAIIISHAHLDHVGGIKWLASHYDCKIITTPYTSEIINRHSKNLSNRIVRTNVNSTYRISKNIEVEFINVTHSIPQSTLVHLKTSYGSIIYALDYKNDNHPVIGGKTNIKRLREIKDVLLLIADSTNVDEERKTFSETIAREMLKDIILGMETEGHGIFLTTFSSHIARLKSMLEIAKILKRRAVFIGKSLYDYIESAEKLKLINFSKDADIIENAKRMEKKLAEMNEKKSDYIFIVTGGMGEKDAVLTQIVNDELPIKISENDFVIFSCEVIPTPTIQANRQILEDKIRRKKARIFKDIHVSGHASREDLRDLIKIVSPLNILPAHGDIKKCSSFATLANEMGYELGKNVYIIQNGQSISL